MAARDSSRAIANGQDLFIALCEDSSIYGLFKNMAGESRSLMFFLVLTLLFYKFMAKLRHSRKCLGVGGVCQSHQRMMARP